MTGMDEKDLRIIQQVQRARMMHDAEAVPSQVGGVYWIEAKPAEGVAHAAPTPRAGQWMLAVPAEQADAVWERVKAATQAGQLGYKARIATVSRNSDKTRMIHVKTADRDDAADVGRVRQALDELGITGEWGYQ
jgi:hypothetical protein